MTTDMTRRRKRLVYVGLIHAAARLWYRSATNPANTTQRLLDYDPDRLAWRILELARRQMLIDDRTLPLEFRHRRSCPRCKAIAHQAAYPAEVQP